MAKRSLVDSSTPIPSTISSSSRGDIPWRLQPNGPSTKSNASGSNSSRSRSITCPNNATTVSPSLGKAAIRAATCSYEPKPRNSSRATSKNKGFFVAGFLTSRAICFGSSFFADNVGTRRTISSRSSSVSG